LHCHQWYATTSALRVGHSSCSSSNTPRPRSAKLRAGCSPRPRRLRECRCVSTKPLDSITSS
jgi:hypothetical protein